MLDRERTPSHVIPFKSISEKKARKWMWFGLAALAAIQIYFVQELLAALLLFAVLFALLLGVALILFLFGRAGDSALSWAQRRTARSALLARRWTRLEEVSRKLLHRPRSQTAP